MLLERRRSRLGDAPRRQALQARRQRCWSRRPRTGCRSRTGIPGSQRSSSIGPECTRAAPAVSPERLRVARVARGRPRSARRAAPPTRAASSGSESARICGREQRGVLGIADGDGRDGDPARHLHDREQRVQAAEVLRRDRHADDRQHRLGGEHARQVGGPAGAGDDHRGCRGRGPSPRTGTGGPASGAPTRPAARTGCPAARASSTPSRGHGKSDRLPPTMPDDAATGLASALSPPSQSAPRPRAPAPAPRRRRRADHGHVAHLAPLEHASLAVEVDVHVRVRERARRGRRSRAGRSAPVPRRLTIAAAPCGRDRAERQPQIARRCCSNWRVTAPSIVQ